MFKFSKSGFYLNVVFFSLVFLFVGNRLATWGSVDSPYNAYAPDFVPAVVLEIVERTDEHHEVGPNFTITNTRILFTARITRGELRGSEVTAEHSLTTHLLLNEKEVEPGDRVLLVYSEFNSQYFFANYIRINYVMILGGIFFALIVWFGRQKGFNAIVALAFTCMAIFAVFIPAILAGHNIYAVAIVVCIYAILATLLMVVGPNKKALASILGCLGGVFLAGLMMLSMNAFLNMTGFIDQETQFLTMLENPIDLRAIIFAGVIIGSVGAIMDVSMSISSSLWELRLAGGVSDFASIFESGINIGKDILGTMLNTLILAYIGSSLSLILLISAHTTSFTELFNAEMVIVEFLRALVGSFGMLLAIPLTAGICGWLYSEST